MIFLNIIVWYFSNSKYHRYDIFSKSNNPKNNGGWWKDNTGLPAKVLCWKICNVDTTIKKEPGTLPQWWFGKVFTEIIWINIKIQIVGVLFNALKWWGTVDFHDRSWPLLKSWYSIVSICHVSFIERTARITWLFRYAFSVDKK